MSSLLDTRRVCVAIVGLGLFVMAARNVTDPDVGWHLRTGQVILQTHRIPRTDSYSFTRFGQPWIDHEWLSQVVIYATYRVAVWGGLLILFAGIIAAAHFLVYVRCAGKPYLAGLMTIWGAWASAPAWGVRPQVFSLLFASLFLFILDRSEQRRNLLWWTVPLTAVWVNMHGGYAIGIGLLALSALGTLLDYGLGFKLWRQAASRLRILGGALLACLLVIPLNPNGTRLYAYPLETVSSASIQGYIVEWASPNFHQMKYLPMLFLLLAILAALAFSVRRVRPRELLLLLVTAGAALHSVRHIPIFALVAVPVLSALLSGWMEQLWDWPKRAAVPLRSAGPRSVLNAALLLGFAVFVVIRVTDVIHRQPQAEARTYPAAAVAFLATQHLPGPLLNPYDWGGYFIWKLYPEYRVFIDGRSDLYGDQLMDEFAAVYQVKHEWKTALERWHITAVVAPPTAPLAVALRQEPAWQQVYGDDQAVVLVRQGPETPARGQRRLSSGKPDSRNFLAQAGQNLRN